MHSEKARLRAAAREHIAAMGARARAESGAAIVQNLLQSGLWQRADTVFCYVGDPARGEVDTRPLLRAALAGGKTLAVPLCVGPGVMQARVLRAESELRPGRYGLPEPPAGAEALAPGRLSLCVVPCLAAAPNGARLGWGGGYYDRFLPKAADADTVALCRERVLWPALPCTPHDVRVGWLATERGVLQAGDFVI